MLHLIVIEKNQLRLNVCIQLSLRYATPGKYGDTPYRPEDGVYYLPLAVVCRTQLFECRPWRIGLHKGARTLYLQKLDVSWHNGIIRWVSEIQFFIIQKLINQCKIFELLCVTLFC